MFRSLSRMNEQQIPIAWSSGLTDIRPHTFRKITAVVQPCHVNRPEAPGRLRHPLSHFFKSLLFSVSDVDVRESVGLTLLQRANETDHLRRCLRATDGDTTSIVGLQTNTRDCAKLSTRKGRNVNTLN